MSKREGGSDLGKVRRWARRLRRQSERLGGSSSAATPFRLQLTEVRHDLFV